MLKEACIADFLTFVNNETNIGSDFGEQSFLLEGQQAPLCPPAAPPLFFIHTFEVNNKGEIRQLLRNK